MVILSVLGSFRKVLGVFGILDDAAVDLLLPVILVLLRCIIPYAPGSP